MSTLWTARDAARATGGRAIADWQASGVSIDSRTLQPGDLFVALNDQRDGHKFVGDALAAGAAAALVSHIPDGLDADGPFLIVDDALVALTALGAIARARTRSKVIAITGSAGKTSTKDMLRIVLEKQGKTHAAERSFNNHWGVPLTLARLPTDADFAVIEIGMNKPGEIAPLAKLARPHVAMITNIGPAHLQAFDDLAAIAREKASISEGLETPDGVQIICADLPKEARDVLDQCPNPALRQIRYGTENDNPWHLVEVVQIQDQTIVRAHLHERGEVMFKLAVPGKHFALNALGVLAAVEALGADPVIAAHDLATWTPPAGRGRKQTVVLDIVDEHLSFELYDDAFNANPASIHAALEVLAATAVRDGIGRVAQGRRVCILGDMLELGRDGVAFHQAIASHRVIRKIDAIHTVGALMRSLHDALPKSRRGRHFETADDAAAIAHQLVDAGDVVLVKGSKGSRVSLVVDALSNLGHARLKGEEEPA